MSVSPIATPVVPASPSFSARPRVVRQAPCDATSCDYRTEVCCESESERFMTGCPKKLSAAEAETHGHKCGGEFSADYIGIGCLSSADCGSGLMCCAFGELTRCTGTCEGHEACVPERPETCHAGSRCVPSAARSGGECVVAAPSTACGNTRCNAAKAGCRYDRKTKRGQCLAVDPSGEWAAHAVENLSENLALMRCTSPKDCAGERCCTGGPLPMTECSGMCMSGIDVCDTIADCPVFLGPPIGCEADPAGPSFLKTCRYRAN